MSVSIGVMNIRKVAAADDARKVCKKMGNALFSRRANAPALAAVSPNL